MPKQRTGSELHWHHDHWDFRLSLRSKPRRRPVIHTDCTDRNDAEKFRVEMVRRSLDGTLPVLADLLAGKTKTIVASASDLVQAGLTVGQYADGWLSSSEIRKLESWESVESLMRVHLLPTLVTVGGAKVALRDVPIRSVERPHMKELVFHLDEMARRGVGPNGRSFKAKTACNVWSVATSMFADAEDSKDPRLQCIAESPCVRVRGPDLAGKKNKVYLYPAEFLLLVNCAAIHASGARFTHSQCTCLRASASCDRFALPTWTSIADSFVFIARSSVRRAVRQVKIKLPKNRRARWVPFEKAVVPLLRALVEARPTGPLLRLKELASGKHLAAIAREHLVLAGIPTTWLDELLAHDDTRERMRFHDWRATGITWLAYRGVPPLHIMQRSGHQSYDVLMEYVREAENLRNTSFGEPFPPLPDALVIGLREDLGLPTSAECAPVSAPAASSAPLNAPTPTSAPTFLSAISLSGWAIQSGWATELPMIGQTFGHKNSQLLGTFVEAPGIEPRDTSVRRVVKRREDDASRDERRREAT